MSHSPQEILKQNDKGTYTIPSPGLYPYQWNWDSAIVACAFLKIDEHRAWQEIETLVSKGQWENGMIPHILFHEKVEGYFPGPDKWNSQNSRIPSSSISQPPILASMMEQMLKHAQNKELAEEQIQALYPKILEYHRWWYRERDPNSEGLVLCYHPWESGVDNNPMFDDPLARVPETKTQYQRKDITHVDPSQRPHKKEYDRYIYLVEFFRSVNFDPEKLKKDCPFQVYDIGINSILHLANYSLKNLSTRFGTKEHSQEIESYLNRGQKSISRLFNKDFSLYLSYDRKVESFIEIPTSTSFFPLLSAVPSKKEADLLLTEMKSWIQQGIRYSLPTVKPGHSRYEPRRYWRGSIWPHIHRLLAGGLRAYGFHDQAIILRDSLQELIKEHGFLNTTILAMELPVAVKNFLGSPRLKYFGKTIFFWE